jgi:dTDP-4-amino-4,6-dideoxygalactose transaminase
MNKIRPFKEPLHITRPPLPDRNDVYRKIDEIWDSHWLTNIGTQHRQFESKLKNHLGVSNISLFCNGTLALQLACQALRLSGEVITTPFTFAATPHVLYWNRITPVFCDIDPNTFNLDPKRIESMITPNTTAILPVHVFGYPCDVHGIQKIADRYGLRVIYDAAHSFGVEIGDEKIGSYGDISMFSFHATKIYHTLEGGALAFSDERLRERLEFAKNFGFKGEDNIVVPGINAKMNEFQAAIGLLMLDLVEEEIKKRKKLTMIYRERLKDIPGINFRVDMPGVKHNYYNFVIIVEEEIFGKSRDELYEDFKQFNIFTRKYFYPLCSQFQCYKHYPSSSPENLSVAEKVTKEVLSLPLYGDLEEEDIHKICDIIEFFHKFYFRSAQRFNLNGYDITKVNNDWIQNPANTMANHLCANPSKIQHLIVK